MEEFAVVVFVICATVLFSIGLIGQIVETVSDCHNHTMQVSKK